MAKFSFLSSVLTVLFAAQAGAQLVLPAGHYRSTDGCTLEIRVESDGVTTFRADKGAAYITGEMQNMIVSRASQIYGLGICKSREQVMLDGRVFPGSKATFKVANNDNVATTYLLTCGGRWDSTDYRVYFAVSKTDNSLLALRSDNYIVRWSLPNGYHSGPIKTNEYPLSCQKFTRVW